MYYKKLILSPPIWQRDDFSTKVTAAEKNPMGQGGILSIYCNIKLDVCKIADRTASVKLKIHSITFLLYIYYSLTFISLQIVFKD